MAYEFRALPTEMVKAWRAGGVDANGQVPERVVSDGGNPCRHCLSDIPDGKEMLILAHRPFDTLNPYAEVGPIFICADCQRRDDSAEVPPVVSRRPRHLLKGYSGNDRIVYGTGQIVTPGEIPDYLSRVFQTPGVEYVDVRSALNNCFTVRIKPQNMQSG